MDAGKQLAPARLARDVQQRNVLFIILDGVVIGLMSAGGTFISVFVIRLGASPFWVSLLSSVPSAIALIMVMPWSQFAARQTRLQQVFAWSRFAVHLAYLVVLLLPFFLQGEAAARAIIIAWALSAFPRSLFGIFFTLVMGHAVPPERRAFLMSRRWTALGVAQLIAVPLASQIIARVSFPLGYQIVYGLTFVFSLGALYCGLHIRLAERVRRPAPAQRVSWPARIRQGVSDLVQAKDFTRFMTGKALFNLGLALVSAILPIYWVQHLDASDDWVGYFSAALSGATLISYMPWVWLKRKLGSKWTLVLSVMGSALYPALTALARTPAAVLPMVIINGLVGGGLNLAFFDTLLDTCPPDKEEQFVAFNMTVVNLMGMIGPPLGAALLGVIDIRWVLVMGTVVALGGAVTFALPFRSRPRAAG